MKESIAFLARSNKESRQVVLKRPELPGGFQGNVFKDGEGEGCRMCDQLMDVLLTGWWGGNQESDSFWFRGVYMFMDSLQLTSSTW